MPKFKYAWQAFIENTKKGNYLDSARVGDLFSTEASAIRAARHTLGYKSGRFPLVRTFKVRVSISFWQKINATEIAR